MKKFLTYFLCVMIAVSMTPVGALEFSFADSGDLPEKDGDILQDEVLQDEIVWDEIALLLMQTEENQAYGDELGEPVLGSFAVNEETDSALSDTEDAPEIEEPAEEPEHVHKYKSKVTKKATCTKSGVRTYTCKCGDTYQEKIPKLGHKYKKKVLKKAKCTKGGKVRYKCTRCGKTHYKKTKKLGHSYKKTVLRKATCTHTGKAKYKCKRCGKKYKKTIKKKVHHPKVKNGKFVCRDCGTGIKKLVKYQKTLLARDKAVSWAKKIAADNDFHYGKSKWAHHNGCYFCGTNQYDKSLKLKDGATLEECEKTYCCNPFVTAAYCHGAGAAEVDCTVSSKRFGLANDPNKVVNSSSWKKVTKPSRVTKLLPGDILLTPTHAMIYAGGGKVVHAAHHDNGVRNSYWDESIIYEKIPDRQWNRTTKIYRYMGVGKYENL